MTIEMVKDGESSRKYRLTIKESEIETEVNRLATKIAKTAKVDGYRIGHVPIDLIRQKQGESLIAEAFWELAKKEIGDEIKKSNLDIANPPSLDDENLVFDSVKDFTTDFTVEFYPPTPEINFDKIEAEKPKVKISEEDIEKELNKIAELNSSVKTIEDKDHKIKNDDIAVIDFVGSINGENLKEGTSKDYYLEIGSNSFVKGFEDALLSHKVDDIVDFDVTFPENYHSKKLSNQKVNFHVTIKRICEKVIPPVDDELAKIVDAKNLQELKDKMKEEMEALCLSNFYDAIRKPLFDFIIKKYPITIPDSILSKEIDARLAKQKDVNEKERKSEKTIKSEAETALMIWNHISSIVKEQKFKASQAQVENFIKKRALGKDIGSTEEIMRLYDTIPSIRQTITEALAEEFVIQFILSKVKVKEIELDFDKFNQFIADIKKSEGKKWKIK